MQSVPRDSAGASELTREGLRQAIVVDTEKVRGHLDEVVLTCPHFLYQSL